MIFRGRRSLSTDCQGLSSICPQFQIVNLYPSAARVAVLFSLGFGVYLGASLRVRSDLPESRCRPVLCLFAIQPPVYSRVRAILSTQSPILPRSRPDSCIGGIVGDVVIRWQMSPGSRNRRHVGDEESDRQCEPLSTIRPFDEFSRQMSHRWRTAFGFHQGVSLDGEHGYQCIGMHRSKG
jgi:hypothetical protein